MADYVSPEQRRRIAGGLMAAQYAENPPSAPMGYDWNAAPLSPGLMNFAAQRGQPGVIQKTLGLIPGFDQDGKRAAQSWGNALMSTAQFPIDAVAGMGQALTAPARAYRGEFDPTSEEGVGEALNVAGNAMMGGLAAPKPRNVVGSAGGDLKGAALGAIPDQAALMDRTYSRFGKSADPAVADLDMGHAARMQRANDLGFDTGTTWYHGTSAGDFNEFAPGKRGATFFADQPYVTDYFANPSRTDGPARVIPTYSRANKLFDPSKEADNPSLAAHIADNINQYDVKSIINPGKTHTKTVKEVLDELRSSSFGKDMFEPVEHPVVQSWIKKNGYDGFVVNDGSWMAMSADKPARIMGVFDPSKIRSVNAAFDPAKADSANLLFANGGKQGAGIGSAIGSAGGDLKGAALGAIPDTPGIRATNISDISTAGPLPNRILAYHGAASKFDNLDLARAPDVGLHYGTLDVTDQFSGFRDYGDKRGVRAPDNSRIYPVILDGSRMARAADGALFDETAQAHSFLDAVKKGKIEGVTNATPGFADLERNMSALPYGDASANPIVRDWLTSNGLDGVIYPNTYDGSGVSAMMWKNVRSALGNNDLLYANGGRGGAATGAALGAIPDTPGIRAYHGSPHDFDKFDLSKIGTGEGAQAYGHGLYFAENEGVARSYRDTTSGKNANVAVQTNGVRQLIGMLQKNPAELEQALRGTAAHMNASGTEAGRIGAQEAIAVADSIRAGTFKAGSGRMYEVNIKASPDDFLDWDKRLGEQSANVRDKVKSLMLASREIPDDPAGAYKQAIERYNAGPKATALTDDPGVIQAYDAMRLARKGDKAFDRQKIGALLQESGRWSPEDARRTFLDAGIPGIKYLDRGSRTAGDGTSNYVVFDDKLIEILRKYGLLGMAGGAAAAEYSGNSMLPSRPASPQYRPGDA